MVIRMKVEHIMSKDLIVLDVNTSVFDIAKVMKEKDVGFIPIADNKKIIGVITDRDIVVKILANNDDTLKGYINKNLIKINSEASLEKAVDMMGKHKVKRLLVEKDRRLVGVISLSDILNNLDETLVYENIKKIFGIYRNTDEYLTEIDEFKL